MVVSVGKKKKKVQKAVCRERGWGRVGGPFSAPSQLSFFHVPTPHPTHTPGFTSRRSQCGGRRLAVKGPVIQVWGLEGRYERNQLDAPTPSLSFHSLVP